MDLTTYRKRIEEALQRELRAMGAPSPLLSACEYALLSGGKRLRPLLVLITAEALGDRDVMPAALSVEYFHTASLIADDLPCMDDDDERRSRPSLHKAFGESVALLASYTLIAAGYGGLYRNATCLKRGFPEEAASFDEAVVFSLEVITRCAGIQGATHGQYLDLYPPNRSLETIRQIIFEKTVTLFEISLTLGWLFGGGSPDRLAELKRSAQYLGMAFQIADDLEDAEQDGKREESLNIARVLGSENAHRFFESEMESLKQSWQQLGLWTEPFQQFYAYLMAKRAPLLESV